MQFDQLYACTPRVIKMDVYPYNFDVRVHLTLQFWTFWANFLDVNTFAWTSSETLSGCGIHFEVITTSMFYNFNAKINMNYVESEAYL